MDTFGYKAVAAMNEFDPTEIFFQKMYRVCFKAITPITQQIDQTAQKQLENCFLRYFRAYKIVCDEAHKHEEDFIYGDDDEDEYEDEEDDDDDEDYYD